MVRKPKLQTYHRFLDESGDTTFFGKGKVDIVRQNGVSKTFSLGMVHIKQELAVTRQRIVELQNYIVNDPYFKGLPSVQKRQERGGFFFHAKDDYPDVRKVFFDFLRELPFSLEVFVGRKISRLFIAKHNANEDEFYADLLSHLLKNKMNKERLVLNVAARGNSTRMAVLESAARKAKQRFLAKNHGSETRCKIVFNVQTPLSEPLLAIPDYALWAVQRVFEAGETRYYDALFEAKKIPLVVDLYDRSRYQNWGNYYSYPSKRLTANNKIILIT